MKSLNSGKRKSKKRFDRDGNVVISEEDFEVFRELLRNAASDPYFFIVLPDGTKIPGPFSPSTNGQKDKD